MGGLLLIYDGDCRLCDEASRRVVSWAGRELDARRTPEELDPETAVRVTAAGIRNEMAVVDPASGEIRTGLPAILAFLRDAPGIGALARAVDRPWLRGPLSIVYRTIAYNRRVIAPPPPRDIACACDPDPHLGFNALFLAVLLLVAAAGAWVLRPMLSFVFGVEPPGPAVFVGVPFALTAIAALLARKGSRFHAAGHTAWILAAAAVPLLLGGALSRFVSLFDARRTVARKLLLAGMIVGALALLVAAWRRAKPWARCFVRRSPA